MTSGHMLRVGSSDCSGNSRGALCAWVPLKSWEEIAKGVWVVEGGGPELLGLQLPCDSLLCLVFWLTLDCCPISVHTGIPELC